MTSRIGRLHKIPSLRESGGELRQNFIGIVGMKLRLLAEGLHCGLQGRKKFRVAIVQGASDADREKDLRGHFLRHGESPVRCDVRPGPFQRVWPPHPIDSVSRCASFALCLLETIGEAVAVSAFLLALWVWCAVLSGA